MLRGKPEDFVEAYYKAHETCQDNNRDAQYLPDTSRDINTVAFKCEGEEVIVEADADESSAEPESTEELEAETTE